MNDTGAAGRAVSRRTLLKRGGAGVGALAGAGLLRPIPVAAETAETAGEPSPYRALYSGIRARAAVALQFDDGLARDHSFAFPRLEERGLVAGASLVSTHLDGGENLTVAQALELQANGWEIICHSRTHQDNLTGAAHPFRTFVGETAGAKRDLEAMRLNVSSFQQPGLWTGRFYFDTREKLDSRFGRSLEETFAAVFASVPFDLWNYLRPLPVVQRYGGALAGGDSMSLDTLLGVVDNAVQYGALAHVRFHSHNIGRPSRVSEESFTAFLDHVRDRVDEGVLANLTPTAAMFALRGDASTNLLGDGSFEESTSASFRHWVPTGSPTVESGSTGKYLSGVDQANHVSQFLRAENLRSLRFEGLARGEFGGAATARVVARLADGAGNSVVEIDHRQPVGDWTKVGFTFGSHPDARYVRLWLYHTGSGPRLEWDDVRLIRT